MLKLQYSIFFNDFNLINQYLFFLKKYFKLKIVFLIKKNYFLNFSVLNLKGLVTFDKIIIFKIYKSFYKKKNITISRSSFVFSKAKEKFIKFIKKIIIKIELKFYFHRFFLSLLYSFLNSLIIFKISDSFIRFFFYNTDYFKLLY